MLVPYAIRDFSLNTMLSTIESDLTQRLTASLGNSTDWQSKTGDRCNLWFTRSFEIIAPKNGVRDSRLRQILEDRKHLRAATVILLAESDTGDRVRVLGPQAPFVPHDLDSTAVLNIIETAGNMSARQAASFLEREFRRLAESVLPGIRVKELLTPHYLRTRMRQRPRDMQRLQSVTENLGRIGPTHSWRTLFNQLGYKTEQLPKRGYLLRHNEAPVAVIHPMHDAEEFSRMNENGELPDGLVLKDCLTAGANWGILASGLRFRLFQAKPTSGSATARWIEIDVREIGQNDKPYLGLLSPNSLKSGGWLTEWAADARDFGQELRKGLEERLRSIALPKLAQGIGRYLELNKGVDLNDRENRRDIEEAVLTFVFRFMFLLHVEARGYLPVQSPAYNPHSATKIGQDCLLEEWQLSDKSTQRWDRIRTLVRMVRSGDRSAGVPHYNGSLFAPDRFPGASLLEEIEISDTFIAPAIRAIAYDLEISTTGLDYAGLQVGHLGAIYESLLSLKLTRANEDLKYDTNGDVFRPMSAGEAAEIFASELFYQTEKGGRKAGGVYYTREEFVDHLLNHSLKPALANHLEGIKHQAKDDPIAAADNLFNFSVLDPAMGSGHFLTAALDKMADEFELFLAEIGGLPAIRKQLDLLRQGQDSDLATVEDVDLLRRLILKRCIFGVDISPMAVEVANVTLWLTSFVPGLALSYLGSNLKCGDALIGVAGQDVVDVREVPLFAERANRTMRHAVRLHGKLAEIPDVTPDDVHRSQVLDDEVSAATAGLRRAFNLWAAEPLGFFKAREMLELHADQIVSGDYILNPRLENSVNLADRISDRYRFFHWPLEFPHVFHSSNPGFDVVVGNPPWEKVKFEKPNFLALQDPGYRGVKSGRDRDIREKNIFTLNPKLLHEMEESIASLKLRRNFFRTEQGYSQQGSGDTDTYKLFCERYVSLTKSAGTIGVVLPRAAFINQGSQHFRGWLFSHCSVRRIDFVLNNKGWAFDIHGQLAIALVAGELNPDRPDSRVALTGPSDNLAEFRRAIASVGFFVDVPRVEQSYITPMLKSQSHANLFTKMHSGENFNGMFAATFNPSNGTATKPSDLIPYTELHESKQRRMWNLPPNFGDTPVWKGRSFYHYEPHGRDPAGIGIWDELYEFIVGDHQRSSKLNYLRSLDDAEFAKAIGIRNARIAFRDVTSSTNSRTVVACLIPPHTPLTHTAPFIVCRYWNRLDYLNILGVLNSLAFDWIARRYVSSHLSYFILNMLTFPAPQNTPWQRIGKLAARLSSVDDRFAEFATEIGVGYGPQSDAERDDMRAEIDALVAKAYDLTEDELRFVFTDFTERAVTPAYRQLVLKKFEML